MKNNNIVTINGQSYDAVTGLPVAKSAPRPKPAPTKKAATNANSIHPSTQRSQTLNRRVTKKPTPTNKPATRTVGRSMDIARSKSITRFAPHPVAKPKPAVKKPTQSDIGPVKHPLAAKAQKTIHKNTKQAAMPAAAAKSAKTIKEEAITKALSQPIEPAKAKKKKKKSFFKRRSRMINISTISIILLIVAGYFTYLNMPNLSVRVASMQAGINATYPEYHPDGYSINGPVTYGDGEVTINFRANTGSSYFTVKQAKSNWDSSAVKDKVNQDSKGEFITTKERGLTIYTYDGNASWVNGGILYSITGDAPLSGDQIRRIATSL